MRRILFISVSVLCLSSSLAHAGFEWTPPTNAPRQMGQVTAPQPQQAQQPVQSLTNNGPLTPEPIAIEPMLDSDILDVPPPPPVMNNTRRNSTALPAAIDEPEMLAPPINMNRAGGPAPQVFVPTNSIANKVDGFGRRIPLSIALKQIVPPLYVYKFESGVTPKQKVSWQGGNTWVNVLNDMLDQSDLSGRLNGNVITISKGAQGITGDLVSLPASSGTRLMPTSEQSLLGQNENAGMGRVVDLQNRKTWSARSGASLREALQTWARQAGVKLEWQSDLNYPIGSVFNFEGTFDQAVDSLLSLYADDKSPPKGKLYPNQPNGPSVLIVESL